MTPINTAASDRPERLKGSRVERAMGIEKPQASELAAKEGEVVYAVPEDLTEARMKEGSVGKP